MYEYAVPDGTVQEPWDSKTQKRIEKDLKDLYTGVRDRSN